MDDPDRSDRRVWLVTGAGGRVGSALCRTLAPDNHVVAAYRTALPDAVSSLQRFVDPLAPGRPLPENAHPVYAVRADLTVPADVDRLVEVALARHGMIDVVVDAVGLLPAVAAPRRLALAVARRAWAGRDEENRHRRRHVVNVATCGALGALDPAAVDRATRVLAGELERWGVRANVVAAAAGVPAARVVDAVVRLDVGRATGRVLAVDARGRRLVDPHADIEGDGGRP